MLKKTNFFLIFLLSIFSINLFSQTPSIKDATFVVERHFDVLDDIDFGRPSASRNLVIKMLRKMAKGNMTEEMLQYFSIHLYGASILLDASKKATKLSRKICQVNKNEPRHTDDEVDAARHFIWTAYLALKLKEKMVLEIQSMQENRSEELEQDNLMDLYNNELGLEFVRNISNTDPNIELKITEQVNHHLSNDDFYIIQSKVSKCQKLRGSLN